MGIKSITLAAIALVISSNTLAATVLLDMNTDPVVDEGWLQINSGGSHTVSGGILSVTAPSYYEFRAPSAIWQDTVSNSAGWVIETRMRRDSSSIGTPGIWINDGSNLFIVGFTSSELTLSNAFADSYTIDTSTYHTYRFEGIGDSLDVFVDGSLALSFGTANSSGGTFVLDFGDLNQAPSGNSFSQWDYFSVTTVPIPSAVWLFGSGLIGLIGVARRKA